MSRGTSAAHHRRWPAYAMSLGFRVWGLGFRVQGFVFGVQGLGFGIQGLGFRVWGVRIKFRVLGFPHPLIIILIHIGIHIF